MKQLAKNKKFIYALLVFWLLQGVYFTLTTLMEPILQFFNGGSMDSLFIGTLGTILTITGVITTLVLPIASDRSKSKRENPSSWSAKLARWSVWSSSSPAIPSACKS